MDCSTPNGSFYEDAGAADRWTYADQDALRGIAGSVALPDDAPPITVAPLGDDVVILEQAPGSELRVRVIGPDGTTRWVTSLGNLSTTEWQSAATSARASGGFSSDFPKPIVHGADGTIDVLWAQVADDDVTLTLTTVATDGSIERTTPIKALSGSGWLYDLHDDGDVTVARHAGGWDTNAPLSVERYDADGELAWSEQIPGRLRYSWGIAAVGTSTYATAGDHFVRFDAEGTKLWDRPVPSSAATLTAVRDDATARGEGDPALIVGMAPSDPNDFGEWMCILDEEGEALAVTYEDNRWYPDRAWLTPTGVLVLGQDHEMLHGESGQNLVSYDRDGNLVRGVSIANAGGRSLYAEVTVEGVAPTGGGDLLVVGSRADFVEGFAPDDEDYAEVLPEDLIVSNFLVRLPAPAGHGDLGEVPPPK